MGACMCVFYGFSKPSLLKTLNTMICSSSACLRKNIQNIIHYVVLVFVRLRSFHDAFGILLQSIDDVLIDNEAAIDEVWQFERIKRIDETCSEPIKYVAEAPAQDVKLVIKRGPKPNKKLGSSWSIEDQIKRAMKKSKEPVVSYPNTANNMFVAVDTLKSQRVRKPKIYLNK